MLALIGGGGSILATPALLYVVGVADAHAAIGTSAMAVSVNAFANLIPHARRGHVNWTCAATFSSAGIGGALAGSTIGKFTDASLLLPLFAIGMIGVGVSMLVRPPATEARTIAVDRRLAVRLWLFGLGAGLLAGFYGIGGGFLIVPALIAATGMPMLNAIGTSLFAVGAFGATTAASYALSGLVDWRVAGLFILGGLFGGATGAWLAAKLAPLPQALPRLFACVVFAVAAYMLWRSYFAP